uniref:Uncharacterized protein n=1 Tax=Pyxicephalus adspersus TaxID=30357 RepID=A0AAV3ATU7_PYXAD|nr:TPA: hypothetical protein GDO54_000151 [Pyxicephalus adspersus]
MALVKSGWLWRQSSVLRRWKRHWFDLWMDGGLVYYPDDSRRNIEERIVLNYNCLNVRSGHDCGAWKTALQDMRSNPIYVYNPYDDYYQTVPMNAHQAVYVNRGCCGHGYGPGHILVRDERDTLGEQMALGLLAGALTTSALSSLIWLPCWF